MLLSAGLNFVFLFSIVNFQKICILEVRGNKNVLSVLERGQEPLKYLVHSEPEHI